MLSNELQRFIETAPVAAAMFDRDLRYLAASKRWIADYRLETPLSGRSMYEVAPEIPTHWRGINRCALAGETMILDGARFERADGRVDWVRSETRPWYDEDGVIGGIIVFAENITAQKQMEEALRRSAEQARRERDELDRIYQNAPVGLALIDRDLRFRRVNYLLAEMTGFSIEELEGRTVREIAPGVAELVEDAAHQILETGRSIKSRELSSDNLAYPGVMRHYCDSWSPLTNEDGEVTGFSVVVEDITERKRLEEALVRSRQDFVRAQEMGQIGWWRLDLATDRLTRSEETYRIFGFPIGSSLTNRYFYEKAYPEDRAGIELRWSEMLNGGAPYENEHRIVVDGGIKWVRSKAYMERGANGEAVTAFGIVQDVTDRKNAEDALRHTSERLQMAQAAGNIGIWDADFETDTAFVNEEYRKLFGVSAGIPLTYEDFLSFVHPDDRANVNTYYKEALAGNARIDHEFRIVERSTGAIRWVASKGAVQFNAAGKPVRSMGATYDITERKRMEEELREADQRKDEFIATLSHELRNPLAAISNAIAVLNRSAGKPLAEELNQAALKIAASQTRYLKRLIEDLMDISRISHGKIALSTQSMDLSDIVNEAASLVQPQIVDRKHTLVMDIAHTPIPIIADRIRIVQALANLLDNAAKYTPNGGRIEIVGRKIGAEAHVTVRDNGVGIAPDNLSLIFEPFMQVRNADGQTPRGLGIGLRLVRQLIELHGGHVDARSAGLGNGSEFVVRLPLDAG